MLSQNIRIKATEHITKDYERQFISPRPKEQHCNHSYKIIGVEYGEDLEKRRSKDP